MTRDSALKGRCLVAVAESTYAQHEMITFGAGRIQGREACGQWDCSTFLNDPSGLRLAEEMVRRIRPLSSDAEPPIDAVAVTLPGTLDGHETVLRSTRLGI